MSKINRFIAFKYLPGSWGLKGKTFRRAEAEYHFDGEDLERALCDIDFADEAALHAERTLALDVRFGKVAPYAADIRQLGLDGLADDPKSILGVDLKHKRLTPYEYDKAIAEIDYPEGNARQIELLKIDLDHKKIDKYVFDKAVAGINFPEGEDLDLALLDVELEHKKITDFAWEKACATVRNEYWIGIVESGFDANGGVEGLSMVFDWNDQWIAFLRANGYVGQLDEHVVKQWFEDVNRTVRNEEEDGGYNFVANAGRRTNRVDRGNGQADYV